LFKFEDNLRILGFSKINRFWFKVEYEAKFFFRTGKKVLRVVCKWIKVSNAGLTTYFYQYSSWDEK